MTSQEVNAAIRDSLGLPPKPEPQPTVPQEGHICDFPIWSYSKKRSTITKLIITYEDGSFFQVEAPKGFPGVSSPGYLDVILFYGQRDLFHQNFVELSAYSVMKHLHIDPEHGSSYANFVRDMERNFALMIKTDRFIDFPGTGYHEACQDEEGHLSLLLQSGIFGKPALRIPQTTGL